MHQSFNNRSEWVIFVEMCNEGSCYRKNCQEYI